MLQLIRVNTCVENCVEGVAQGHKLSIPHNLVFVEAAKMKAQTCSPAYMLCITGRYAEVYRGGSINGVDVAIKCFAAPHRKMWHDEKEIYKLPGMRSHENIARFFGVVQNGGTGNPGTMWIVVQYYPNGSIYDYLKGLWLMFCEKYILVIFLMLFSVSWFLFIYSWWPFMKMTLFTEIQPWRNYLLAFVYSTMWW